MRMTSQAAALAVLAVSTALSGTAALAQTPAPSPAPVASAPAYPAVADLVAAVRGTAAFRTAFQQIQTQYKAQFDAYNAKSGPYGQELQRLQQEIQTLQNTPGTTDATIQARVTAYQSREQAIRRELAPLAAPFERPLAYAEEQLTAKLDQAVRGAMAAKRVTMLIRPDALAFALPTANITGDITTQLNALIRTVSITPPAGWQPGGQAARPTPAAGGR